MKKTNLFLCILSVVFLLGSCSFEKRLYNKGYHIDWSSKNNSKSDQANPRTLEKHPVASTESVQNNEQVVVSTNNVEAKHDQVVAASNIVLNETSSSDLVSSKQIEYSVAQKGGEFAYNTSKSSSSEISASQLLPKNKALAKKLFRNMDDDDVLIIVLAFVCPPFAMFMYEGKKWSKRCTLSLILTCICWAPGVVYTLMNILGKK